MEVRTDRSERSPTVLNFTPRSTQNPVTPTTQRKGGRVYEKPYGNSISVVPFEKGQGKNLNSRPKCVRPTESFPEFEKHGVKRGDILFLSDNVIDSSFTLFLIICRLCYRSYDTQKVFTNKESLGFLYWYSYWPWPLISDLLCVWSLTYGLEVHSSWVRGDSRESSKRIMISRMSPSPICRGKDSSVSLFTLSLRSDRGGWYEDGNSCGASNGEGRRSRVKRM